ncbi:1,2-phenylacetyl-CoA epoxidase subunit PaaB [Caldalkalibacillus salinus]|uniref:1,2-phenylacetyl-CoA epoxidase subunit PaaB n=1 Tax=Caldalkalibacillus salinus TaxID=2803787 RepID=UPI001920E903|nr:1,2-phenylacetyl-CoA epoxidase subunit PaaB [Caldalkalibacillus salinus]
MSEKNTNYPVFEVFVQRDANNQFIHHGSLLAPNADVALSLAKENFTRRQSCYNLWVVERNHISQLSPEERKSLDKIEDKQYRETKGYGYLKKKWRQYEQEQLTERNLLR